MFLYEKIESSTSSPELCPESTDYDTIETGDLKEESNIDYGVGGIAWKQVHKVVNFKGEPINLLHNISGAVLEGEFMSILGISGEKNNLAGLTCIRLY